jgi:hypothetical protein
MSDVEQYAQFFTQGLKITVCIPMDNNELFRDWAIVEELEEDILTVQLSRDELPDEVHLIPGVILDLRLGKDGVGFRCSSFFVGDLGAGKIYAHLTGDVGTSELREFYRIDLFLPFRCQFTEEQNLNVLIGKWRKKKQNRLAYESERREIYNEIHRELLFRIASGEFDAEGREQGINKPLDIEEFNPIDETWDDVNASAINLSAGGFKFVTSDDYKIDEHIFVEMFVPSTPPRIMDCIARVVFKSMNYGFKDSKEHFNVALNFELIDDRERDAIVTHISHIETLRIRQKRQLPSLISEDGVRKPVSKLQMALCLILSAVLIFFIFYFYYEYSKQKVHNEIQDKFGEAVKQYREMTGTEKLWKK